MGRDEEFFKAEMAMKAERYNDFTEFIKNACMAYGDLSVKEKDLLFKGYQQAVGKLREQRAHISVLEQKDSNATHLNLIAEYGKKVEDKLTAICKGFIELIDSFLLPVAKDAETIVFYKRMNAEQYFYMAEAKTGDERQLLAEKSKTEYEEALHSARTELTSINLERLLLESSQSLFYYKILNEEQSARDFAKRAAWKAIHDYRDLSGLEPYFTPLVDLTIFGEGGNSGFFNVNKVPEGYVVEAAEAEKRNSF